MNHHETCNPDAPIASLEDAPALVAMECAALRRTYPIDQDEAVRRVKGGLGDEVSLHFQAAGIRLSDKAFRAVLHLVAEMMVAQHEHDQPTVERGTRR